MSGVGRLQAYRIHSHRLVYKEVAEVRSTIRSLTSGNAGAHIGEGFRESGPLSFFQTDQTVPSLLASKSQ